VADSAPIDGIDKLAMTLSHFCRAALAAGFVLVMSLAVRAATVSDLVPDELPQSLAGSYLAGRSADAAVDIDAAATFFTEALKSDPDNGNLLERVLILRLANGEIEDGLTLAKHLIEVDQRNPLAHLALASASLKQSAFADAQKDLAETAEAPLATLTAGLFGAWAGQGLGRTDDALKAIDALTGPNWYGIFKDYHHALVADLAGRTDDAVAAITRAYKTDNSALRIVEGYARILARAGKTKEALASLVKFTTETPSHPTVDALLAEMKSGKTPAPIAASPQQGAAEVLYGLGTAIGTDEGMELPAAYLQLARDLNPSTDLIAMAIGDLFQGAHLYERAIAYYSKVPESADLHRAAEIQIGASLDALDRPDEGAEHIKRIVDRDPSDLEAVIALGNLYRGHDRFEEAAAAYSRGLATVKDPARAGWRIYYSRGVALEQSKHWPEAEADFNQALAINPDQPQVLNYLGYSWVDMGIHLDKALAMIKTAVDLRPNDGYIVDSLGWAYYRLARYDDAVNELQRAVELKPADATINEHFGDALWKVGRKREALFQWMHSRDLGPEKGNLPRVLAKIDHGLPAEPEKPAETPPKTAAEAPKATLASAAAATPAAAAPVPADAPNPPSVTVEKGDSLWKISVRVYGQAELYERIFKANRDHIADPDRIFPGMTLTIPSKETN
jgi:tetratricopeptide (TPR) repeat protein